MAKRRGHGEGGIYQRESDGKWCASVDLGFVNGKRRRKVIYGKTRKAVADKLKAVHRDQAAGLNIAPEQQTVAHYLDRWLDTSITPHRHPKTAASYAQIVRLYLKPALGQHQLAKLTPEPIQLMLNHLLEGGGVHGAPLSTQTIHYVHSVLRRALKQVLKWGYVARNVAILVDTPRVEKHTINVLTPEQGQRLLSTASGHRREALYSVALLLGLREGAVVGLRWSDIAFTAHTLRVGQTVQRVSGRLLLAPPKTESSKRLLPLLKKVERALARHAERPEEERAAWGEGWNAAGLVFPSEAGTPIAPRIWCGTSKRCSSAPTYRISGSRLAAWVRNRAD